MSLLILQPIPKLKPALVLAPNEDAGVRVSTFGADLAALKAGVAEADATGLPLYIDIAVVAVISAATDPVLLPSDLRMDFIGSGSVTWSAFGLPLFWAKNVSGLRINNPVIYFSGMAATTLPAVNGTFYNDVLDRNSASFPARDAMAAIALFGAVDCAISNPRFLATDFSSSANLMQRAITIANHEDGSPSTGIRLSGITEFDGVTMGLLAWGVDGLEIDYVATRRWGQLNIAVYTWEVACHAVYISAQAQNANVVTGPLVDEGEPVPGANLTSAPPHSFKLRKVAGGSVESIVSHRGCGALEWCTTGTAEVPYTFGPIEWWGTTNSDMTSAGVINMPLTLAANVSGQAEYTTFESVVLHAPSDMSRTIITAVTGGSNVADLVRNVTFESITIDYPGSVQSASVPLIAGSMSGCYIAMTVLAPNWVVANANMARFDSGGSNNVMDFTTQGPVFASVRFVEQDPTLSSGNFATFREYGTSNVRTVGPTT